MTVRDLANHLLDLPAWTLIVIVPLAAFFGAMGKAAAQDLHLWRKKRR